MEDYNALVERMNREAYISTPIFRDANRHPFDNELLCTGYTFFNGDTYILSISHRDAPIFNLPLQTKYAYTTNCRVLFGADVDVLYYYENTSPPSLLSYAPPYVHEVHNYFRKVIDCNRIVPLTVWSGMIKKLHNVIIPLLATAKVTEQHQFVQNSINVLHRIEYSGLAIDPETFNTFFENKITRNNFVYTQYNPFTTTGRPSNRFNGINYAALNKSDGSRASFVSRFENGTLVQLDFESYHLRLIGNYASVSLPNTSLHYYLATQYFGKDNITQEEYDAGKQKTFSILYGDEVDTDIPLLNQIKKLSRDIYKTYKTDGVLRAPYSKRVIPIEEHATENKVFNYFVQSLEFEATVMQLKALLDYLDRKKSKLILYTYDAVLLDCHPDELNDVISASKMLLGSNIVNQTPNAFPLKVSIGKNYNTLSEK